MSMLNILENKINSLNLFEGNMPPIITAIADSIPSQTIPYRMKVALAISEIILFTSQFRINIKHWNGSSIPINSIMFCIAKSGASKDSSLKAARKCFTEAYDIINKYRKQSAIDRAIQKATEAGNDIPDKFAGYKDYYIAPNPLFIAISTPEGFIQHLNDLSEDKLGAGYIYSGEIGSELSTNSNITETIKLIAELYDEGSKEVKVLKARENQSKEVKNLPVSALFIGSQDNLLYDETIKHKFKTEFTSKLARRSFFIFVNKDVEEETYTSIEEMLIREKYIEDTAISCRNAVSKFTVELTNDLLNFPSKTISVTEEVRDLFTLYKKYNEAVAATIDSQYPIAKLTRTHLQWKALKLSGALALMECSPTIDLNHYKAAVEFVELINNDVAIFEKELVKEPYELFADYVRLYAIDNEYSMNLHNLRKLGFIPMKGKSDSHLKELVKLVNSYDTNGTYELKKDTIYFKELTKTESIGLSYIPCSGTKQQRAKKCNSGFQYETFVFSDLEAMLAGDYAYSPFKFMNGVRGKDNIIGGCKWLVLDVDSSESTDEEVHILLSDINHYVVRTSNKDNPCKFRVLIELDSEIDIPDNKWKIFIETVANDLGLVVDSLPKSQIFFSYSDRDILSVLDGEPLQVKQYLDIISSIEFTPKKTPTKSSCKAMLDDPFTTFERAFNAKDGEGSRKLIWAVRYARELGANLEYCINLLDQISSYWVKPLQEDRLETMKNQISRWVW